MQRLSFGVTGKKDKRSRHHSLASDAKENLMRELELQTRFVWTLSLNLNNLCSHPDFPANLPQNCMCLFGVWGLVALPQHWNSWETVPGLKSRQTKCKFKSQGVNYKTRDPQNPNALPRALSSKPASGSRQVHINHRMARKLLYYSENIRCIEIRWDIHAPHTS